MRPAVPPITDSARTLQKPDNFEQLAIFKIFADSSVQGLGMADLEGNITYANNTLCRMIGAKDHEDACRSNIRDYFLKEDLARLENELLPAVMTNGHHTEEIPLVSVNGILTHAIQSVFLIRDDQDKPLCFANVITDITEQKLARDELKRYQDHLEDLVEERIVDLKSANEALKHAIHERKLIEGELVGAKKRAEESEERFRKSLEFSPVPIALADNTGRMLYLNKRFIDTYGYTLEDIPTMEQWIVLAYPDPEYRSRKFKEWDADVKAAIKNNAPTPAKEYSVTCRSGEVKTVEISAFFGKDLSIGLFHDITDRKRAEAVLHETNELFSLFIRNSPIYTYIKEVSPTKSRVLYASENFEEMVGIPGSKIKDKTMEELFPPDFAARITADDWAVVSNGNLLKLDEDLNGRNYTTIKFPISLGGKILLAGYTIDITEQKRIEKILRLRLNLIESAETEPLHALIRKALDKTCEITNSPIGFHHLVHEDQKTLTLQEWSTRTLAEFCMAEGRGRHYGIESAGVWVDCIRERRPVIHNDYASLPHRRGLPPGHAKVIRELVVPIIREGKIVSVLGIGNKPIDYDEKDLQLVTYIADIIWGIIERRQVLEELSERAKELNCLYEISRLLVEHKNTMDDICRGALRIISRSWQYEEIACTRITIEGRTYKTDDFTESPWRLLSFIKAGGLKIGAVEVFYREEKEQSHEGPFLKEERDLINGIAELLGIATEQKKAEEKLTLLRKAMETIEVGVTITDKNGIINYTNPAEAGMHGYHVEDLIGRHSSIFSPHRPLKSESIADINSMVHWKRESVNVSMDGKTFPVQLISTPVRDEAGNAMGMITISEDITERKRIEEQLKQLATTDPLTGCYNRRHFFELGNKEFERSRRYERPISGLILDIDHFKNINDRHGHPQGDKVLIVSVEACLATLRKSDIFGRIGGEEFAVIFIETSLNEAIKLAERIRHMLSRIIIPAETGLIKFTVSVGVTEGRQDDKSLEDILKRADDALYNAKNAGRDRVVSL